MDQHDGLDDVRQQIAHIHQQGFDGGGLEDAPETDAQRNAKRDFFAQYDDAPLVELDEDGDPVEADPELLAAAEVMYNPSATADEIEEARAILLESVGGFDSDDDEDDAPQTRAERVSEMADAVRQGMKPLTGYEQPGEVDDAIATRSAIDAVAKEAAIQERAKMILGVPGYGDQVSQTGPRSPEDRAAIQAVRELMLRQKGIEPADTMNPPLVDELFDDAIAADDAAMDKELGLPEGTTTESFAGGLDD